MGVAAGLANDLGHLQDGSGLRAGDRRLAASGPLAALAGRGGLLHFLLLLLDLVLGGVDVGLVGAVVTEVLAHALCLSGPSGRRGNIVEGGHNPR